LWCPRCRPTATAWCCSRRDVRHQRAR
jgi:hypothetical protein